MRGGGGLCVCVGGGLGLWVACVYVTLACGPINFATICQAPITGLVSDKPLPRY